MLCISLLCLSKKTCSASFCDPFQGQALRAFRFLLDSFHVASHVNTCFCITTNTNTPITDMFSTHKIVTYQGMLNISTNNRSPFQPAKVSLEWAVAATTISNERTTNNQEEGIVLKLQEEGWTSLVRTPAWSPSSASHRSFLIMPAFGGSGS